METSCGLITLLGSGETSLAGGRIFETIARRLSLPVRIAALETPAGFELNSAQVAGRVTEFLQTRLKNYSPHSEVIPARKRGTAFSPDDPRMLAPLSQANLVFMGPGSPTYAVRQLKDSLAWDVVRARQRSGAALVFASAATIAVGRWCLPVYEIYKVGQDVFSTPGLDLFSDFGLKLSFIPHWNNADGGAELDTSRCFIGAERFQQWKRLLPAGETVIGLDEHTGLMFDFSSQKCFVRGRGDVVVLMSNAIETYHSGSHFSMFRLGELRFPEVARSGISTAAWKLAECPSPGEKETPPSKVLELLDARSKARKLKDWNASDRMRQQITELGWDVQDSATEQSYLTKSVIKRH